MAPIQNMNGVPAAHTPWNNGNSRLDRGSPLEGKPSLLNGVELRYCASDRGEPMQPSSLPVLAQPGFDFVVAVLVA